MVLSLHMIMYLWNSGGMVSVVCDSIWPSSIQISLVSYYSTVK